MLQVLLLLAVVSDVIPIFEDIEDLEEELDLTIEGFTALLSLLNEGACMFFRFDDKDVEVDPPFSFCGGELITIFFDVIGLGLLLDAPILLGTDCPTSLPSLESLARWSTPLSFKMLLLFAFKMEFEDDILTYLS